ncbi:MAG: hypothetical protein IKI94_06905 [Ruminococcus sp.]|nr:hypothetical protein [Ruminococcus sp.]
MKMTFKKITAAVMAVTTLAVNMVGISASASYQDSTFTDYSIAAQYSRYTPTRLKEDNTPASIKVTNTNPSGCKMTVRVYGTYTSSSTPSGGTDYTYGSAKVVGVSNSYTYLPNLVGESLRYDSDGNKHNVYAYLGFKTYSTTNGTQYFTASGKWSPDSV